MIVPFTLSLVFAVGLLVVAALLLVMSWRSRNPRNLIPDDLPVDVGSYGPAATNRWLRVLRLGFIFACMCTLAFHGYWVFGAPGTDAYDAVSARDQRARRLDAAGLKGWIFDRTGRADRALAGYRMVDGRILRSYPLGDAAVNLSGYSDFIYGSGGLERAYVDRLTTPASVGNALVSPAPVGTDVKTTIDVDMQRAAYELLKGKRGAAVVLALPSCDVLAMASSPSFDPGIVDDEDAWKALKAQAEESPDISPLTDRTLKSYYLPGSTFKVLVATAAIEAGLADQTFTCSAGGFTPPNSRQPIFDDSGGGHGTINMEEALRVSCNEYFAQMGLKLGSARLADVARRFGIETDRSNHLRDTDLWRYANAKPGDFNSAFAPPPARVFLPAGFGEDYTPYDLAIESFGQGPNQMTILELALIAAGVANPQGQLSKPAIEADVPPALLGQVCQPQTAARVREMMRGVVENGTARAAFAQLAGRVTAGGKTGTAQRVVTVYDPKTGKPKTETDRKGNVHRVTDISIDALFMGFAPYDNPQIAFAMIVENGGHGGTAAAPIAVGLIQKAADIGIIAAPPAPQPSAGKGGKPGAKAGAKSPAKPAGRRA